jgi:hypothetical protein
MGEVFLAEDTVLGRDVAVKHILPGDEDPTVATQRLLREARSAARIHHPNVVTVHDLVLEGNDAYIVMEYVPAENLAQVLRRGPLDPRRVARIGAQVADALAAAHALGIIHRDVKPSNILLAPGDVAKLTDFGVARVVGDTGLTQTGHMIGSIAYMPPEIARGADPAPAADLYSLGATLFAAVEGHSPFAGRDDSSTSVAMLVRLVTETAPAAIHAGVLAPLIADLLNPDPTGRPAAAAAADALRAALTPSTPSPTPVAGPPADSDPGLDEEALIETRIRVALPAAGAEGTDASAAVDAGHTPAQPTAAPTPPDEDADTDDRTVRRPARTANPVAAAPATVMPEPARLPTHPEPARSQPSKSASPTPVLAEHATPGEPARPVAAGPVSHPAPGNRPLTPNQRKGRRRSRILTGAATAVALAVVGTPLALLIPASPPSSNAGIPAATDPTEPTSHGLPTPAEPVPFDYKTYATDGVYAACIGLAFSDITARVNEGVLIVDVTLEKKLGKNDEVDVTVNTDDHIFYVSVYPDYADALYNSTDDKSAGQVDAFAEGPAIHAEIPVKKLKPTSPVSVNAHLWKNVYEDMADGGTCGPDLTVK